MIPATNETHGERLYQSRNVTLSVMSPSMTINHKVLIQQRFDKVRGRIRQLSSSCDSSANNWLLFLSQLPTNQDLEGGSLV